MSGSGREAITDVRKSRPDVRECLGGPPVCSVVLGRSSRMSRSGREVLPNVQEWSGGPPGCSGVIGRPSRMSESGR